MAERDNRLTRSETDEAGNSDTNDDRRFSLKNDLVELAAMANPGRSGQGSRIKLTQSHKKDYEKPHAIQSHDRNTNAVIHALYHKCSNDYCYVITISVMPQCMSQSAVVTSSLKMGCRSESAKLLAMGTYS